MTLLEGDVADLWHAGTQSFYRAKIIETVPSELVLNPENDLNNLEPSPCTCCNYDVKSSFWYSSGPETCQNYVFCVSCGFEGEAAETLEEAVNLWNKLTRCGE